MGSTVRVRLFAPFDRLCGRRDVVAEFPSAPRLTDVLSWLVEQHPALGGYIVRRVGSETADFENYFLACVGKTIVLPDDVIPDGAEINLFAPHAGG